MPSELPRLFLARHGETAWTLPASTPAAPTCR